MVAMTLSLDSGDEVYWEICDDLDSGGCKRSHQLDQESCFFVFRYKILIKYN